MPTKPNDRSAEYEYRKKEREMRKRNNLCIQCGQQDAYTFNGRSRCAVCAEKAREADKRRYSVERHAEYVKKWAEQGKCVRCGREPRKGFKLCHKCSDYLAKSSRERRIQVGGDELA